MGLRGPGARAKGASKGDIMSGKKLRKVLPWQKNGLSRVEKVFRFLEDLPITAGSKRGDKLVLRQWQREWIEGVYSTDEQGKRHVTTAILSMGRKNGKTQLIAGLALCHLVGPEAEDRGEVYACAMDKLQAGKAYEEVKAILNAHDELGQRVNIKDFNKEIHVLEGDGAGSLFKALSADADSKLGLSPSFVICDEAGYWKSRALYDAMDSALGARDEPLICIISTQAKDDHHFFSQVLDDALAEMEKPEGERDMSVYAKLYAVPEDADPYDPAVWDLANPALGDFLSLDNMERSARAAQRMKSKEPDFKNKSLNMRIDATVSFIRKHEWTACQGEIDERELEGRDCYAGLDLSSVRDLTAWVLVFPDVDGRTVVLPRIMTPEGGLAERAEDDRAPYVEWADAGHLIRLPGNTINKADVVKVMHKDIERFNVIQCGYDRWKIADLQAAMEEQGVELPMMEIGQGYVGFSPCVDALEKSIADTALMHDGNPVLTLCAANAVVTTDPAGARKLDKSKASGRIDGIIALAMALRVAEAHAPVEDDMPACMSDEWWDGYDE